MVYAFAALVAALAIGALFLARKRTTDRSWQDERAAYVALLRARGKPAVTGQGMPIPIVRETPFGRDACESCHRGVQGDLEGEDVPLQFRRHPGTLLARHRPERFGCTPCHRGAAGELEARKAHARDTWERQNDGSWGWTLAPAGEAMLLARRRDAGLLTPGSVAEFSSSLRDIEAGCATCHGSEAPIVDPATQVDLAPTLTAGRALFRTLRCAACHEGDAFATRELSRSWPLDDVGRKIEPGWMLAFMRAPRTVRRTTAMPAVWPVPVDPRTREPFAPGTPGWDDADAQAREESLAVAAFLFGRSERDGADRRAKDLGPALDAELARYRSVPGAPAEEGALLFERLACDACHRKGSRGAAPSLEDAGDRLREEWVAWFLERPRRAFPEARMPSFRLDRREAASLAMHLARKRRPGAAPLATPLEVDAITAVAGRREHVRCAVDGTDATRAECGERLFRARGCAQCHRVAGIERERDHGPSLAAFATRERPREPTRTRVADAWGDAMAGREERSHAVYRTLALKSPRIFARPGSPRRAPDYTLDEAEIRALSVVLESMTGVAPTPAYATGGGSAARGEWLMSELGCAACHGATSAVAPSLEHQGARVVPAWLASFLLDPGARGVRPRYHPEWAWGIPPFDRLTARCPTYALAAADIADIARAFAARDGADFPFPDPRVRRLLPEEKVAVMATLNRVGCMDCHFTGELPRDRAKEDPTRVAPALADLPSRLRPEWLPRFLARPADHGAAGCAPFPGTDADRERARDFLFSFTRTTRLPKPGDEARAPLP